MRVLPYLQPSQHELAKLAHFGKHWDLLKGKKGHGGREVPALVLLGRGGKAVP